MDARGESDTLEGGLGERGPSQVRMDDDAGRIQDPAQARSERRGELGRRARDEIPGRVAGLDLFAGARERRAHGRERQRAAVPLRQLGQLGPPQQLVHGRQLAERVRPGHALMIVAALCG
jgi:hypothetical protein